MATTKIQRVKPLTIRDARRRWMMAYGTDEHALDAQEIVTTSDQRRLWRGDGTLLSGGADHGTVATEAALATIYLLPSCTRGVWPGDTAFVTAAGCEYRCISGSNATATWRAVGAGTTAGTTAAFAGLTGEPGDNAALAAALNAKQTTPPNASTTARITEAAGLPLWNGSAWPGGGGSASDLAMLDWQVRVERMGGVLTDDSLALAQSVLSALRTQGLLRKIMRLDLWLGTDLRTALIPLIDRLGKVTSAVGLTNASFAEASGMTFDGSSYILTGTQPADLGGKNGGLGWWEAVSTAGANVEPLGCYDSGSSYRYVLELRDNLRSFRWGNPASSAGDSAGRAAVHYYGQRSSNTLRRLYIDGSTVASNTTADPANGSASGTCMVLGGRFSSGTVVPWTGRSKLAYLTDGSLSDAEAATLHAILADFVAATGR